MTFPRAAAWLPPALVAGCLACGACGSPAPHGPRPNILLVTLDTTRADRIGCYGNQRIATPNLDRLAAEGVLFENAFTPVPSTLPSHCSIMTGMYPARHGVHDNGVYRLDGGLTTLAERLRDEGYRTGAFVSAYVLDDQFGLAQGFEAYDDRVDEPLTRGDPVGLALDERIPAERRRWLIQQALPFQRRADSVSRPAIDWLRHQAGGPFFLWVHYFDPHASYSPPAPWDTRYDPDYHGPMDGSRETFSQVFTERGWSSTDDVPRADMEHMIARYDGEVSFMDVWIGKLFDALRSRGLWDDTLVVAIADHGEAFGEHGQIWEHNSSIFDEVVHVPLIIKPPRGGGRGRRVADLVRTLDVAPTILQSAHAADLEGIDGRSLLPYLAAEPVAEAPREILLEALRERQALTVDRSWLGLRSERYKLVLLYLAGGREAQSALFDLPADPRELAPLTPPPAGVVQLWTRRAVTRYDAMKAASGDRSWRGIDEMTSEALRSLGYVK